MKPLLLIIGSGRVVKFSLPIIKYDNKYEIAGFVTDGQENKIDDIHKLGSLNDIHNIVEAKGINAIFIGVGNTVERLKIFTTIKEKIGGKVHFPSFAAKDVFIDNSVKIGSGVIICHYTSILFGSKIGNFCIIEDHVSIGIDVSISDFNTLAPGVLLPAGVKTDKFNFLGVGCCFLPDVSTGENVIVAAGATVIADIGAGSVIVGNPGRPLTRKNLEGNEKS